MASGSYVNMGLSKALGRLPHFYVVGEACKINHVYLEEAQLSAIHPIVKQVGLGTERPGLALLVKEIFNILGAKGPLLTLQHQYETLFIHKKTHRVLMHLKPDRQFGYVNNYLDIKVAKHHRIGSLFTWESYKQYVDVDPIYVFYDNDEIDFPEENISRLISEAPGPVYVSTRKRNLKAYDGAAAIIVSEKDYKNCTTTASNLIITLGTDGASYNDKIYPIAEKHVAGDNYGCRETFFAIFVYAHTYTGDIDFSIAIANKAASKIAGIWGYARLSEHLTFFKELREEIFNYQK